MAKLARQLRGRRNRPSAERFPKGMGRRASMTCGLLLLFLETTPSSGESTEDQRGDIPNQVEAPAGGTAVASIIREAAGANAAAIQSTVDQFRTDLGTLRPNTKSAFLNGRREINWDGVADTSAAPSNLPGDFFNNNSPRGVVVSTPGSALQVSADSSNATSTAVRFGNLNATYSSQFQTFSAERVFAPVGSNVVDVTFFVPGTNIPATVTGFGAVFTDVDNATSTKIRFFDPNGVLLLSRDLLPAAGSQGLSFLGVSFQNGQRVAKVQIINGNTALGPNDNPAGGIDAVAMDDFIYAEPQAAACPPQTITGNVGQGSTVYPSASGVQTGRLSQNGVDSSCAAAKACPGVASTSSFAYDSYEFANNSSATKCVTFSFPTSCGTNQAIHPVAYLGSFNPSAPCANYLGDLGHSINTGNSGAFSVDVPANSVVVLVVHEVGTVADCPAYSFSVSGLSECYQSQLPCPPATITGNIGQGSSVYPSTSGIQTGRLSQTGVDSSCATSKTCPGIASPAVPFAFDAYQFANTSASTACVTFNFPTACGVNQAIHPVAYLGSFDPSSPCTNYLGDVGHSINLGNTGVFSVNVPANSIVILVVHEIGTVADCPSYSFSVSGLPACPPTPCMLVCPANITVSTGGGNCGAVVNFPAPSSSGTCGTVTTAPASGTFFPKGPNTVRASGAGGATCTFNVTVVDAQSPAISCPANVTSTAAPGQNSAVVTFPDPPVSDNCQVASVTSVPASGSSFPVGTTTVTCTATDSSSNTSTCTFNVTVDPGPSPTPTPTATPSPTPTPTPTAPPGSVANVSTRLPVGTGNDVLIEGFIVQGPAGSSKKIMVRAIGPSLVGFGIADALANPTLEIHDSSGATVATNNDWKVTQVGGLIAGDQSSEISNSGLAPANDLESAIISELAPGSYTAVVRGLSDVTGTAVVDAYDLLAVSPARLANIATRGLVQPGDKLMIAGFIVQNAPVRAVVLAIGPSLSAFGINNALPDTTLQLRDQNGTVVRENDDWRSDQQAEIESTALQPSNDLEAALVATLPPGQYTAQVRGKPEGTGIGVVQVYFLQ
jgi:hypothetical protein